MAKLLWPASPEVGTPLWLTTGADYAVPAELAAAFLLTGTSRPPCIAGLCVSGVLLAGMILTSLAQGMELVRGCGCLGRALRLSARDHAIVLTALSTLLLIGAQLPPSARSGPPETGSRIEGLRPAHGWWTGLQANLPRHLGLIICIVLGLLLLRPSDVPTEDSTTPAGDAKTGPPLSAHAELHPDVPSATATPSTDNPDQNWFLRGTVVDPQGIPLPEAEVYLCEPTADYVPQVESPGTRTDSHGRFAFTRTEIPANKTKVVIVALHDGHVPGIVEIGVPVTPASDITVTVRTGTTIRGVVLTSDRRPVVGATVVAAFPEAEGRYLRTDRRWGPKSLMQRGVASTHEDGTFVVGCLAETKHDVTVWKAGYEAPPSATAQLVVYTGNRGAASDIHLTLDPVVGCWLHLVDGDSGTSIAEGGGIEVLRTEGIGQPYVAWTSYVLQNAWSGEHPLYPGEFRAVFFHRLHALRPSDLESAAIDVRVHKTGFKPTTVRASVRSVADWDQGRGRQRVELEREPDAGFGRLRVRIVDAGEEFAKVIRMPINLKSAAGELRWYSAERVRDADELVIGSLPCGRYSIAGMHGDPGSFEIRRGTEAAVRAWFKKETGRAEGGTTGIDIELVDESGKAVTNAALSVRMPDGSAVQVPGPEGRSVPGFEITSEFGFRNGGEELRNLPAGYFRFIVRKPGFRTTTQMADLLRGRITRLRMTLARE